MTKLNKDTLLRSLEDTKEVDISGFPADVGENGTVTFEIRPLSDQELTEAENKMIEGIDINTNNLTKQNIQKIKKLREEGADKKEIISQLQDKFNTNDLDIANLQKQERKGTYLVVAYGLSHGDGEWSPEDVGRLPRGIPDKLADEIRAISEYDTETKEDEENL